MVIILGTQQRKSRAKERSSKQVRIYHGTFFGTFLVTSTTHSPATQQRHHQFSCDTVNNDTKKEAHNLITSIPSVPTDDSDDMEVDSDSNSSLDLAAIDDYIQCLAVGDDAVDSATAERVLGGLDMRY